MVFHLVLWCSICGEADAPCTDDLAIAIHSAGRQTAVRGGSSILCTKVWVGWDGVRKSFVSYNLGMEGEMHILSLHKEPSFSGWCDESAYASSDSGDTKCADYGFELPILRAGEAEDDLTFMDSEAEAGYELQQFRQRSTFTNGTQAVHDSLCYGQGANDLTGVSDGEESGGEYKASAKGVPLEGEMDASDIKIKAGRPEELVSEKHASLLSSMLRPLFYVLIWYTFSTCLTLYNKLLLGEHRGNFPAPLLMNTIHFSMQALISTLVLRFGCPMFRPRVSMTWKHYFSRVVPTAIATALDIDLSNASLVFISVTFATMCKSAAPVFLVLFAFAFKLETPTFKLLGIIFIISVGVMLTVAKETEFNFWGFVFVMLAAIMSGFRWTITQVLLQKEEYGLTNPFAAMSCLTPVMALITAIFSLLSEPWSNLIKTRYFDTPQHVFESCLLMLLGGSLAFSMVFAEYLLISATSAVTFTVAGVVKEVVTIVVAIFFFHDHFTILKGIGLAVIIVGVSLFNWYKYQKMKKGQLNEYKGPGDMEQNRSPIKYVLLEDMDGVADGSPL